jgi:hypothetical protein
MKLLIKSDYPRIVGFGGFWGKTVEGFDDSVHCINCLIGHKIKEVNKHMRTNVPLEIMVHEGEAFYLCGVTYPYEWPLNLHLAVIAEEGAMAEKKMSNGDTAIIYGGRELPIDERFALEYYKDKGRLFYTCRNFQFGVQYFGKGSNSISDARLKPKRYEDHQATLF